MTENMQKINSLVRSGLATSFSLRHLALLWEALIIFYCFTHSQKYDETRTECGFFLSYYSKHHKLFTHETQPHFLLKRSFLLSPDIGTSDLEQRPTRWPSGGCHIHSPLPGTGNISAGFSRCPQDALGPAVPTVGTHLRTWDPQSGQPCAPTQSQLPQKHAS